MKQLLRGLFALLTIGLGAGMASAQHNVTMNVVQIFGTIDPAKITDYTEYMAAVNLYDGLVTVDPEGKIQPLLAERWDVSSDAKKFTFYLKKDATFHDGAPLTAADVVYSVKRLLTIDQGPSYLIRDVLAPDSVKAVDDYTVEFTLKKTFSPFLATVPLIFIENSKLLQQNESDNDLGQGYLADHEAGSGPYTLTSWDRGGEMRIQRFPDYHMGWTDDAIDQVRFILTNDEATVRSLAASGELTMTSQYQATETYDALGKMDRFTVVEKPTPTAFYLKLNTQRPPTDDVHVRKAIACAMDYDTIRNVILPGEPLAGPLPSLFSQYYLSSLTEPKMDMDCVQNELAQSKYAGAGPIPIIHSYVAGTAFEEEIALLFQSTLEPLGFDVTLQPEPWNRITELASKVDTTPNVTQVFFGPTYPSPDSMFFTQYYSKAAGTWASMEWLQNDEVDNLIDEARATSDVKQQAKIYQTLQQKIVDLQPDAFLLLQTVRHAMDRCLTGFEPIPVQSFDYNFYRYHWTCQN